MTKKQRKALFFIIFVAMLMSMVYPTRTGTVQEALIKTAVCFVLGLVLGSLYIVFTIDP